LNEELGFQSKIKNLKSKMSVGPDADNERGERQIVITARTSLKGGCNTFGKRPVGSPAAKNKKQQTRTLLRRIESNHGSNT
jgi:hypothetical protein